MIRLIPILGLAAMVGLQTWQAHRADQRAADWQTMAQLWEKVSNEQDETMRKMVAFYQVSFDKVGGDLAVCTSMLPPEQRKSFAGQP